MEIDIERIKAGYKEKLSSHEFKNYEKNKLIAEGKTSKAFVKEVISRVNLEYMGLINKNGMMASVSNSGEGKIKIAYKTKFDDLIVGNNTIKTALKIYEELAVSTPPILVVGEVEESFTHSNIVQRAIMEQSIGGSCLIKPTVLDGDVVEYCVVGTNRFFVLKNQVNENLIDAIIIFYQKEKDEITFEIYTDGNTKIESYKYNSNTMEIEERKSEEPDFEDDFEGMQVQLIEGNPDLDEDNISLIRELVINDTLTSQAFDKVANPLLEIDEDAVEIDGNDEEGINLKERVIALGSDSRNTRQISLETKTIEWTTHKKEINKNLYSSLAINENVLGISEFGGTASGESLKQSYMRTIARVKTKRNDIYRALEKALSWGLEKDVKITETQILDISDKEKLENQMKKVEILEKIVDMELENEFGEEIKRYKENLVKQVLGG